MRCRSHFDDLHDTGLFSWAYLREMGEKHADWWAQYLKDLETAACPATLSPISASPRTSRGRSPTTPIA